MKRKLLISGLVLMVLAVLGGLAAWYFMSMPLYQPGMVRAEQNLRSPLEPPAQTGAAEFWAVEKDIQLHYFTAGTGTNVLIVHGGPGWPTAEPWPGLQSLTANYRFNYYDQRGCGKSMRPIDRFEGGSFFSNVKMLDQTLGIGAQLADIERIRRILGDEKVIIIGHSFGGFLASLYAAEFPDRVKGLILVSPGDLLVMPQESGAFFDEIAKRLPVEMQPAFAEYMKRYLDFSDIFSKNDADLQQLNAEFGKYYVAAFAGSGMKMPAIGEVSAGGGWMVQAMYFSMGMKHDYRAALKAVTAPVLVIHGDKDLQPEQVSRVYAEAFPNGKVQVISNAGHFSFLDQPQAFGEAVGQFMAGLK